MDTKRDVMEQQPPEVIRQHIEQTRSALTEKLETLEQGVKETVQEARSAVVGTVESVKESVQGAVQAVKHTFDLRCQVEQHPWGMLGGSVAVGFIAGSLLPHRDELVRSMSQAAEPIENGFHRAETENPLGFASRQTAMAPETPREIRRSQRSFLGDLAVKFGPEIEQMKGLAIGAALGLLRDLIKPSLPPNLAPKVENLFDSITAKVGGKPVQIQ
jgi:ElaB/YqjD/DUF883 family membrane-anchored ribosome-binding protein